MFEKRKVKIISKLVGISEAIRLILIFLNLEFLSLNSFNFSPAKQLIETNLLYKSSLSLGVMNNVTLDHHSLKFNEWLGGLIDGDGYFILTKKGYVSCEICMDVRDKKALYEIKQKYGGSIKSVSGAKALKYKLRNKKGLVSLIKDINGLVRNPTRLLQMNKLCNKYDIDLKHPKPLTYNNG
jgi:hypothetical protein